MSARGVQLPLPFVHAPSFAREDFLVAACNRDAVAWLDRWPDWPAPALVVHGPPGCGKTHLTRVFLARSRGVAVAPVMLAQAPEDLAAAAAVVIDDADGLVAAGHERALLHLYNVAAETGCRLLLTGERPPRQWPLRLADLRSRLLAAPAVGIGAPDEAVIAAVLVKLCADRQLRLAGEVLAFALARMERSFAAARRLVERLDALSLQAQRPITPALVRAALAEAAADGASGDG